MSQNIQSIQALQAMQGLQKAQFDSIPAYQDTMFSRLIQQANKATSIAERKKIKDEFLAIFYKELLKQSFKSPQFSFGEENNSISGRFGSDLLVEKLAMELARSKSFSVEDLFPAVYERDAGVK